MKKTKKILILIMFIAIMSLGIGYSAIQNITLDIEGTAIANISEKTLIKGEEFNNTLKGGTNNWDVDTTITRIVFDYWENGYNENGEVLFQDNDWTDGAIIDEAGVGGIRLFKSEDETKMYILSEDVIYANSNCYNMFLRFESVEGIILNNFNTSKVKNMRNMFCQCKKLPDIDVSGFDTSNVTNMNCMFFDGYKLVKLDLSGFNTSNVTDMAGMFSYCGVLKEINIKGWDTSKVTDMNGMFIWCYKLQNIDICELETSNVTNMSKMFNHCEKMNSIDLSTFDISKVTNMSKMFSGNSKLTTIYVGDKWITSKVTSSDGMFSDCTALVGGAGTTYNSSNIDISYARIDGGPDSDTPGYLTQK